MTSVVDGDSDTSLVRRVVDRDKVAFETLYRRHYLAVESYASFHFIDPAMACDFATMEFRKLWQRPGPSLNDGEIIRVTLFKSLRRAAHDENDLPKDDLHVGSALIKLEQEAIALACLLDSYRFAAEVLETTEESIKGLIRAGMKRRQSLHHLQCR